MSVSIVASRYAKSLIELAKEQNSLEAVYQDMLLFKDTADKNRGLMLALKSPIVRHEKKLGILKSLFEARVNPITYAIFTIITRKNRESILDEIALEFIKSYNLYKGIQNATVVSSTPLTDELRQRISNLVLSSTGKQVQLSEKVDPSLIGGFLLRIDDRQIDASLRSRLNELKLQLTN
ncbi:ATP synthase F1 subunit delta [Dyadobacter sandarakinus]|uniref:ATP synthase subunit delta n=1 Tax=Dyadobacter sandarakinus TaxID=2747268 RepID=A0ABX7I6L3_9BACT|nr:ATP synthase F1 subunit delta [Dyadobacter sandarakinus]QRR01742.1 ATP synthase F1 subunit delta [Dyadobacter sandarakinus]